MSSNSVCNHTRDKQIGLPLRGRPILLSLVWLQTELDSTQSYYHYKLRHKYGFKTLTHRLLRAFMSNSSSESEISIVLPFSFEFTIKYLGCSLNAIVFFSRLRQNDPWNWNSKAIQTIRTDIYFVPVIPFSFPSTLKHLLSLTMF